MPLKKKNDYIPIKCEGWNGKFNFEKGTTNNVSKVRRYNNNITDYADFYPVQTRPVKLPTQWDGTFQQSGETIIKPERNYSDESEYYDINGQQQQQTIPELEERNAQQAQYKA